MGGIAQLAWAVMLLVGWPISSLSTKKHLAGGLLSRMELYANAAASGVLMAAVTLGFDLVGGHTGIAAVRKALPFSTLLFWTLGTVAACVGAWAAMVIEARAHPRPGDRLVFDMLPRSPAEHRVFLGISVIAGVSEEYVMRGFCFGVVAFATGSLAAGYLLTTISFGLAHLYQGKSGALRAMGLGAILGIPVVVTGSVLPSIVAHTVTDVVSGRWTLRLLGPGSAGVE
jgi:hypothetical protein